jgi:hypothetical protein
MTGKGYLLLAALLLVIPVISREASAYGVPSTDAYPGTYSSVLDGGPYGWSFDFATTSPFPVEGGGNPGLQAGSHGSGIDGFPRLTRDFQFPEASALVLFSTGLVGLVVWRRKKRFE